VGEHLGFNDSYILVTPWLLKQLRHFTGREKNMFGWIWNLRETQALSLSTIAANMVPPKDSSHALSLCKGKELTMKWWYGDVYEGRRDTCSTMTNYKGYTTKEIKKIIGKKSKFEKGCIKAYADAESRVCIDGGIGRWENKIPIRVLIIDQ
jgi:hypothetical protein